MSSPPSDDGGGGDGVTTTSPPDTNTSSPTLAAGEADASGVASLPASTNNNDDEDLDASMHAKALRSDVSARLAFQLLQQIAAGDALYRQLSTGDLRRLASVLSVLTVAAGEQIIAAGEAASFVAIVLDGTLSAAVSADVTVPLGRGSIVGEHSLYMGGTRNADVHCSAEAVLAVISFAELEELGATQVLLQRQLYHLFAVAAIRKLQRMNMSPAQIEEMRARDQEEAAKAQADRLANDNANNDGQQAVTPTQATPSAHEFLYRTRLEKEEAAAASAAAASSAAAAASAAATMDGFAAYDMKAQAAEDVAKEKARRAKAEKGIKNEKLRLEVAQRKLERAHQLLDERDAQIESLQLELRKKERSTAVLDKGRDELQSNNAKLAAQLVAETQRRTAVEAKLAQAGSSATRELEARYESTLAALRAEAATAKASLESNKHHLQKTAADHLQLLDANRSMTEQMAAATAARSQMSEQLAAERQARETLERTSQEREKALHECRSALRALEAKHADSEERHAAQVPWKSRALEAQQACEMEKRRAQRSVDEAVRAKQEQEEEAKRWAKLLKFATIGTYVREARLRRSLAQVHEQASDLLLASLEENMASAGAGAYNMATDGGGTAHSGAASASASSGTNNGSRVGSGGGGSIRPSLKAVKRRHQAYLSTLVSSKCGVRELVSSLGDEIVKLRGPFQELMAKVAHWKATSEAFFARSIELTSEKEAMAQALNATLTKIQGVKTIMKNNQTEQEEMMQRNAELTRANHALKLEIERAREKAAAAAAAASDDPNGGSGAGVGAGATGVSSPGPSGGGAGRAAQSSAAAAAIEQLQLRQQHLLQTNIAQLQAHYAHLLTSVQSINLGGATHAGSPPTHGAHPMAAPSLPVALPAMASLPLHSLAGQHDEKQQQQQHVGGASQDLFYSSNGALPAGSSPRTSRATVPPAVAAHPSLLRPLHTMHPVPTGSASAAAAAAMQRAYYAHSTGVSQSHQPQPPQSYQPQPSHRASDPHLRGRTDPSSASHGHFTLPPVSPSAPASSSSHRASRGSRTAR